jgi:hypothetical protein
MTYRGQMKNGVVVFDEPPPITEGAAVEVVPVTQPRPRRGSAEAILKSAVRWAGPPEELERLQREVQEMREQDLVG